MRLPARCIPVRRESHCPAAGTRPRLDRADRGTGRAVRDGPGSFGIGRVGGRRTPACTRREHRARTVGIADLDEEFTCASHLAACPAFVFAARVASAVHDRAHARPPEATVASRRRTPLATPSGLGRAVRPRHATATRIVSAATRSCSMSMPLPSGPWCPALEFLRSCGRLCRRAAAPTTRRRRTPSACEGRAAAQATRRTADTSRDAS